MEISVPAISLKLGNTVSTWMGDQASVEEDTVAKNPRSGEMGPPIPGFKKRKECYCVFPFPYMYLICTKYCTTIL